MPMTVAVACSIPNGLDLQVCREEPVPGNPSEKHWVRRGDVVKIAGPTTPGAELVGTNWAITRGVDKEFFTAWLEQNKGSALLGSLHAVDETDGPLKDEGRDLVQ